VALFEYSQWDGSQADKPTQAEKVFDQLAEYLMAYGDRVLRDLDDLSDDAADVVELLEKEGLVEKDGEGQFRVAPKGLRRIQDGALHDLFQVFQRDGAGKHDTPQKGGGTVRLEDSKPYEFGDSLAHLNLHETIRNAAARLGGAQPPLKIEYEDLVVYETEYATSCHTVVLIDMSGSMARYGKYAMTKKVALALQAMVRAQYGQDRLEMVGFYTYTTRLTERELLDSAPKPVSMFDSRIHLRFDLDNLPPRVPQHFTNIHAGLKLARTMLAKSGATNKQIIVITDGEPTAHLEGRELLLIYPPSEKTAAATLAEAKRCAQAGIRVSSFALVEDAFYFGLVNFVEEMARVTRGVAAYCSTDDLGKYVFDSFIGGRRSRKLAR
jgi:uncharacterized protein with von Willebrand factor type A (vWA) domain